MPDTLVSVYQPSIGWKAETSASEVVSNSDIESQSMGDNIRFKDVNGDGIAELLFIKRTGTDTSNFSFDVRISQWDANTQEYNLVKELNDDQGVFLYAGIDGDINNNGITDFVYSDNGRLKYLELDATFTPVIHNTSFYLTAPHDQVSSGRGASMVDVDADGYQDLLLSKSSGQVVYYKNIDGTPSNFTGPHILHDLRGRLATPERGTPMDLDGDGIMDFLLNRTVDDTHQKRLSIAFGSLNNGVLQLSEYSSSQLGLPTEHHKNQYVMADLNGDGLKDFVRAVEVSSGNFDWRVRINKGNRSFRAEQSLATDVGIHKWKVYTSDINSFWRVQGRFNGVEVADLDNDGADELLAVTSSNDDFCVSFTGKQYDAKTGVEAPEFTTIQACNDQIQSNLQLNVEENRSIFLGLSNYDFRRFNWSMVDFNATNDSVSHSRTIANVVQAPLSSSVFLKGQTFSQLKLTDINNDGYIDFHYGDNSPEFSEFSLKGTRVRGIQSKISWRSWETSFVSGETKHWVDSQISDNVVNIWNSGSIYKMGDQVYDNSITWIALTENIGNEPCVFSADTCAENSNWLELEESEVSNW